MGISERDFEAGLAEIVRAVKEPLHGVYGPGSVNWRLGRESGIFVGAGLATLLQLAHPFVAQSLADHSQTTANPMRRFERTFFHVYRIVYGTLDDALASSRAIFRVHTRITGTLSEDVGRYRAGERYEALDADALFWVYATLVHATLSCHALLMGESSERDLDGYVRESRSFALLFGVPPQLIPDSHRAFQSAFDDWVASDRIAVSSHARAIGTFLLHPTRILPRAVARVYRPLTGALLPPRLRPDFGLEDCSLDRPAIRRALEAFRLTYRATPEALRWLPAYASAQDRIRGIVPKRKRLTDRLHEGITRAILAP